MTSRAHKTFRPPLIIGDYLFDPGLGLISGPSGSHYVCPRVSHALEQLSERAGDTVRGEDLVAPQGEGDVASPHDSASRAVARLRTYLRDSPSAPTYIESVGNGRYRLLAPVFGDHGHSGAVHGARARARRGPGRLVRLVNEFRERKVCRSMLVYTLVIWLVFQVSEIVVPALGLPDWVNTLVVVLGILGFPVAATLSWIFDLTPEGLVRERPPPDAGRNSPRKRSDFVLDFALVGTALAVCVALFLSSQQSPEPLEFGSCSAGTPGISDVDPQGFGGIRERPFLKAGRM
jgi:DNA-binding winged helix-turn-helix (wHTH) protein